MLGFGGRGRLDGGAILPCSYALTELTDAEAERIAELMKRAVG